MGGKLLFGLILAFSTALGIAAEQPELKEKAIPQRLRTANLQLALDNAGFTPGVIDGRAGEKTTYARTLAEQSGHEIKEIETPWISWELPSDYADDIAPVPTSWLERSKLKKLSFESVLEKLSEQFHCSQDFFKYLNPQIKDWASLEAGIALTVPQLKPSRLAKADHLKISLSKKFVVAFDKDEKILACFACSIAAKKEKRPVGELHVLNLATHPDYLFDPIVFPEVPEAATIKTKLMIPPGPNNPVGEMWIGLDLKGYGMHGTPWPEDIGKTESHGCFRLANWNAMRLAKMLSVGTPVYIEE